MDNPHFLHLFILVKLKKCTKTKIVTTPFLKEEIARLLIRKGGLSKWTLKYIIEDLVKMGLIKRLNKVDLYLLNDFKEEKKINNLINFG
jgi:DNA-binding MarR family transcriptional regulator